MINNNKNVRYFSFNILKDVLIDNKLLNEIINYTFLYNDIKDEDKSFIKKECTGVIENIDYIDNIINKYSKLKTDKLKKEILIIFRLSIYEILYMDKVPTYATINEAVNIIKNTKVSNLSGYVNATLKSIANNYNCKNKDLTYEIDKYCYLKILNDNLQNIISEFNELGINFYKYNGSLEFKHTDIFYTKSFKDVLKTNSFKNGLIIIQDASSAYLIDKLYENMLSNFDNSYNLNILDTCAAPGGKILSLNYLLNKNFKNYYIEARDISINKINKIKENISRLKINNINLKVSDASILDNKDLNKYDLVLCDVPCSGTGVINKKPDIKLKLNKEKIKSLQILQLNILNVSKAYLKKNGLLTYSTCTETLEENEDNINTFLNENNDFIKIYEKRINSFDENKADGFYMCILKKV